MNSERNLYAIGFIDDDPRVQKKVLSGLPVLGTFSELEEIIVMNDVRQVIVSTGKIEPDRLSEMADICHRLSVPVVFFEVRFTRFVAASGTYPALGRWP